jgi:predicted HTH transcriptional regulator
MQKVSRRQQSVLDVLDEEIRDLSEKLAKVQPMIDELNRLKRTRATLLNERGTTGNVSNGTRLTMEEMIVALREMDGVATPNDLAERLSVDVNTVRSHLNRHKDSRYAKNDDNTWSLIGEDGDA